MEFFEINFDGSFVGAVRISKTKAPASLQVNDARFAGTPEVCGMKNTKEFR